MLTFWDSFGVESPPANQSFSHGLQLGDPVGGDRRWVFYEWLVLNFGVLSFSIAVF